MAHLDTTRPIAYARPGSGVLARLIGTLVDWNETRMTRDALSKLSDRELDDIGLTRGDIDAVASGTFRA